MTFILTLYTCVEFLTCWEEALVLEGVRAAGRSHDVDVASA